MKILLATDGSEYSHKAAEEICLIFANSDNLEIKIISVFDTIYPLARSPYIIQPEFYEQVENLAKEEAKTNANEAAKILGKLCPESVVTTESLACRSASQKIIEVAEEWCPDLIVVGSHGRGFWGRLTLGSVSGAIVHNAPCSVLVVRGNSERVETGER